MLLFTDRYLLYLSRHILGYAYPVYWLLTLYIGCTLKAVKSLLVLLPRFTSTCPSASIPRHRRASIFQLGLLFGDLSSVLLNTYVNTLKGPRIQCIRSTSVCKERQEKAIRAGTGCTETRHPPNCQKGQISDGLFPTPGGKGLYSLQVPTSKKLGPCA